VIRFARSFGLVPRAPALCGLAASGLALAPAPALASGFHVDEQDARATGRAGAVTASTNNASAVYYNSAGIADLEGLHLQAGGSLVRPSGEFRSAVDGVTTESDTQTFVLPQLFASWRATDILAIGVGAYAPFGLALQWPESSPGRTNVRQADLRTFFITPTAALNLSRGVPGLSLGAGLDLVPASVRLERDILFGTDAASVALSGDAFGVGGRVGLMYRPPALPEVAIGVTYRSPVVLDFSGQVDFDAAEPYRGALPPDGDTDTSVTLPQMVSVGFAFSPVPELQLELDGNWRGWSSYDRLEIELPDGSVDVQPKDWNDSLTLRLGAEYTIEQRWSVRAGFVWDETPVPAERLDFQVPDVNRVDLALGFGARITEQLKVDFGALWVLPEKRSTATAAPLDPPVKGRFAIDVWVFGLSVGFELETRPRPALEPSPPQEVPPIGLPPAAASADPAPPCDDPRESQVVAAVAAASCKR
jgi:long-chain fatty acid transport protein